MTLDIGRPPLIPELAHRMNLPVERLQLYTESSRRILSLEGQMNRHGILKADEWVLNDWIACDYPTPQDCAEVDCLKQNIQSALEGLPERERNVLLLWFGLDDGSPKAAEEVAKSLRITKDRVRLIEARALNKLRNPSQLQIKRVYQFRSSRPNRTGCQLIFTASSTRKLWQPVEFSVVKLYFVYSSSSLIAIWWLILLELSLLTLNC
jgi:RNA polymerase primary sigma factor